MSEKTKVSAPKTSKPAQSPPLHHGNVPPIVHDVLRGPGQPLDVATRAFMEPRFGHDFSRVRVHTDARAAESAQAVKSHAYTVENSIVFAKGNYHPDTLAGQHLLAHELIHVLQQRGNKQTQLPPLTSNRPGDTAEREADVVAEQVMLNTSPLAAYNLSRPAASLQRQESSQPLASINPGIARLPANLYVDMFDTVTYDLDYRAEGGRLSEWLQVAFSDGTRIDLHINDIVEESMSSEDARNMMARGHQGEGGRIFPDRLNPRTAPRLYAAKQSAIEAMEESNIQFMMAALPAVMFIITMPLSVSSGPPRATRTPVSRTASKPTQPAVKPASGTGKAPSGASTSPSAGGSKQGLFSKPKMTADPKLPAGQGYTTKFGDVTYSSQGTPKDVNLVKFHEMVHSFLSPKFKFLRNFRADVGMSAYQRSSFFKYLEEALAETYAQLRVNGIKGLPDGIKFPITNGYVTVQAVVTEVAIGTVVVGGVTYGVYIYASE